MSIETWAAFCVTEAVLCLLFLGGEVIFGFALAMVIGIVVGTYSSIFVAAPILLFLEQRFGGVSGSRPSGDSRETKSGKPGPGGGKKVRAKNAGRLVGRGSIRECRRR